MTPTSRPTVPAGTFERNINDAIVEIGFLFLLDGAPMDLSGKTFKLHLFTSSGREVLVLDPHMVTSPRVAFRIQDQDRQKVNLNLIAYELRENGITRAQGRIVWAVTPESSGPVVAPDLTLKYATATQEVIAGRGIAWVEIDNVEAVEAASLAAIAAKNAAEAAQGIAEAARDEAVDAKESAEDSASTASDAATAAGEAKVAAESARDTAVTQAGIASGAADVAVTARNEAVAAKEAAETAEENAESARDIAVTTAGEATSAAGVAVSARDTAVAAKDTAVNAANTASNAAYVADEARDEAVEAAVEIQSLAGQFVKNHADPFEGKIGYIQGMADSDYHALPIKSLQTLYPTTLVAPVLPYNELIPLTVEEWEALPVEERKATTIYVV